MGFQVAIDGPGGSGKSTIAKIVAARLGFVYIDTGAMYRAVGLYALQAGIDPADESGISSILNDIEIEIKHDKNSLQILILNGEDVTPQLRSQEAGNASSKVAVYRSVREKLVYMQRKLAESNDVIMDGRDIGTQVLNTAQIKIYMDADVDIRTQRRCGELLRLNLPHDYDTIRNEIISRDKRDKNREISPLKKAEDAIVLDTGQMSIDEAADEVIKLINTKNPLLYRRTP